MRLIVTGGGTGGHLFPAIAVACGVRRRDPASEILFIGTGRQIDNRVLAGLGFSREILSFSGVKGLGLSGALRSALRLPQALYTAVKIIKRFRPDLIFAVGGYVTGPVLLAAKLLRVPICIHEQNSVPGLANRLAGKIADRVCISLPCKPPFAEKKTVLTGNPVREEILVAAREKSVLGDKASTLLILGGSQGAHRINARMLEAASSLQKQGETIHIIHQAGRTDEEMVRRGYEKLGIEAEVADFYTDMAELYGRADLVVSRAGATTLAELAVMGLPALLIPYPFAADDHQTTNADYYVQAGGAAVFPESELDPARLSREITDLIRDRKRLQVMGKAMQSLGRADATEKIVELCEQLAGKGSPRSSGD